MAINWENRFRDARLLAAAVLVLAFFLPVASCTQSSAEKAVSAEEAGEVEKVEEIRHRVYKYPYKEVTFSDPATWYVLAAFFWPLVALKIREEAPTHIGFILNVTELMLCLVTGWIIYDISFMSRLEFGGYIAYGGVLIYAATSLKEAVKLTWKRVGRALRRGETRQ